MSFRPWPAIPLIALCLGACVDREAPTTPTAPPPPETESAAAASRLNTPKMERLARRFARALRNPAFRSYVERRLEASPWREHKLPFRRFLREDQGRALRDLAGQAGAAEDSVAREAEDAPALEFYFPVPAHRSRWQGDENILVATAWAEGDAPVAFDTRGNRTVLNPDTPPDTPVLALEPVETDFNEAAGVTCIENCEPPAGGGGGSGGGVITPVSPSQGLFLTYSHFTQSFEGWLKGDPEFEFHILGQAGTSDSLTDYQCAGEHAPAGYVFDQNDLNWSGTVMLFSQNQLDAYRAQHPGQAFRVFAVEDDNQACVIRVGDQSMTELFTSLGPTYKDITGLKDSLSVKRVLVAAKDLQKIWNAISNIIKTNDELPGTAIKDSVAIEFHSGANVVIKGKNNVTNGWSKLELR
jgi:hypothetical protein